MRSLKDLKEEIIIKSDRGKIELEKLWPILREIVEIGRIPSFIQENMQKSGKCGFPIRMSGAVAYCQRQSGHKGQCKENE